MPEAAATLIRELIEANELGLALETTVDALRDHDAKVTRELRDEMLALAIQMGIDGDLRPRLAELAD